MGVRSKVQNAADTVLKTLLPKPESAGETDLLDTLKKEHDEVKSLLSDLQRAETSAQRKSLVRRIKSALVADRGVSVLSRSAGAARTSLSS
jgi:hypothetical protein